MKHIFLVGILLIFGGCNIITSDNVVDDNVVVDIENETVEIFIEDFSGDWVGKISDTLHGQKAVTDVALRFDMVDIARVRAHIVGTLSTDMAPAARITIATGEGYMDGHSIILDWEGSRNDVGRAVIVYNETDDTLMWSSEILASTDYTLPEEMVLHR